MLVFLALGNAKVLSFELGDAKVPNAKVGTLRGKYMHSENEGLGDLGTRPI